jgi:hypothetical protein
MPITEEQRKLLARIESWESGYISPSAQIVFRDARLMIVTLIENIDALQEELDALRANHGVDSGITADSGGEPDASPPRKLRNKKSPE